MQFIEPCPFCGATLVKTDASYVSDAGRFVEAHTFDHPDGDDCLLNSVGRMSGSFFIWGNDKETQAWNARWVKVSL